MQIFQKLHDEIQSLQKQLTEKIRSCKHTFRPLTTEELNDKWMSVGARCECCDKLFGWRCKKSPDDVCHYHSFEGYVTLIDGTKCVSGLTLTEEENQSFDMCLYCGMPSERK